MAFPRYFSTVLHRSATLYNAEFMTDFLKIVYDTLVWQLVRLITGIDKLTSVLRLQDIIATFQDILATLFSVKFKSNVLKMTFEMFGVAIGEMDYEK